MSTGLKRFDPAAIVRDSNKITDVFGYWPTFHDAEIHSFCLTVADGQPWLTDSDSSVLDMHIHVFEMTKEVSAEGYFVLAKHTLAHLRFRNVEDLSVSRFSHQNCIFEMVFGVEPMSFPSGGDQRKDHPAT